MNRDWAKATLGDFVRLQRGYDLPDSQRRGGHVPVIGSAGITGYHDTARAKGPGVTLGRSGASFGVVNYSPVDYWPHNAALYVTDFQGNDERFAYYLLKSLDFKNFNSGSAQQSLNRNFIYPIQISIPPLPIQRRIAALLTAYDNLLENNTRRIQILEEMAQRIYEEWFVRFRFPGHENVSLVESELGLIPEGWTLKRLGEALELVYGKALKADEREEGNVPVYGSSGIVGFHNVPLVREAGIIVGRKGNVGSVHLSAGPFYAIDTVYYTKTELPLSYVFFNLKRQNFINNDAAVPGLNRNQAQSLPFILPTENLLNSFDKLAQNLFGLSRKLQAKNGNLRQSRDLLLPKLISGEIDVSNFPEAVTD